MVTLLGFDTFVPWEITFVIRYFIAVRVPWVFLHGLPVLVLRRLQDTVLECPVAEVPDLHDLMTDDLRRS